MPGEDLRSFIRRAKHLAVETAVAIARQIAEGLAAAHRLGVIHRDLKPSNVMIDKEGNAKIMDFGIARTLSEKGLTGAGVMIGTPEYMSPEQAEGKPADERSDIYALGVILFEMVTGRSPFEGETALAIAHKHRYEPAPDPRTLNLQIPLSLSRLILRCLEKPKEKRFQTTAELLKDLVAIEEMLPRAERAPTPSTRRRPTVAKTITIKITPKKFIIPAAALILLVGAAIVLLKFLPKKAPLPSLTGPPAVAILYFKNNTGEKTFDIWREGLCQSLIIKLSQSRHIRVLDQSQIFGILKRLNLLDKDNYTPEELKEIASRGLAIHIIRGSLSKAGERFRVDLTLQNASTLEIITPESADGTGEESLFAMVDDLAGQLKSNLGLTPEQTALEIERSIRDVTTNSMEAYKLYTEAVRLNLRGSWDQSIPYFEKAILADPQFAMAYLFMAFSYNNTGRIKESRTYFQKAFDLRERLSERERYLIEAEYYAQSSERTWEKAIATFIKLIDLCPWNLSGNGDLGLLYWGMEEWDKAIECYEILRRYKSDVVAAYLMLAQTYLAKGQVTKAREVLEGYLSTIADNGEIRSLLGIVFSIQADFHKAEMEIKRAYTQSPETLKYFQLWFLLLSNDFGAMKSLFEQIEASPVAVSYVGWGFRSISLALQGRIKEAKTCLNRELERWKETADSTVLAWGWLKLAHLLEKTGDFESAMSACDKGLRLAQESGAGIHECQALFRRGVIRTRKGDLESAMQTAEELRKVVESGPAKKRLNYYEGLQALIAMCRKDPIRAQGHLQKALALTPIEFGYNYNPRPEFLEYLAEAYMQANRWENAQKAYEEIQSLKTPRVYCPGNALIYARSFYNLAKVLERGGDIAGAADNYRQFLDLWKDADPGRPEVEDANSRLARLSTLESR